MVRIPAHDGHPPDASTWRSVLLVQADEAGPERYRPPMSAMDDRLDRIRRARRRLDEAGPRVTRGEGDFARVAVPMHDGDALRDLLRAERARIVIEIGLGYAASALAISEALADRSDGATQHLVIDAFQDRFHDAGWRELTAAGLDDSCTLLRERSQTALARLAADGFVADAAFVDGGHAFHDVFVDLAFLRQIVRPGGLVILDDCQWLSVATAVRYFEVNAGWSPEATRGDTRLRAYRLPDPRVEPSFEAFEPFGVADSSEPGS